MTLAALARRRSWRTLPLWAIAAGVNTSVLLSVLYWRASANHTSVSALTLTLAGWVGVATYLLFTDTRTRCTHFDLSLPVPARRLWLGHLMSLLFGGLGIVALTMGVIVVHRGLLIEADAAVGGWTLAAVLITGTVVAILLLQVPRPSLSRIPVTPGYVTWTAAVLIATPVLLGLAADVGWRAWAPLVVIAAAIGVWLFRRVPPSYVLAPLEAEEPGVRAPAGPVPIEGTRASGMLYAITIVRCTSAGAKELLGVPLIVVFGVVLGGAFLPSEMSSARDVRFLFLPMVTYILFALTGPRLASLHLVDALPISRRALAAALFLPYLGLIGIGYGVGALIAAGPRAPLEYVNFEEREAGDEVTVPLRVYQLAWDGNARDVESPWGGSLILTALQLSSGSSAAVSSPYSAPPDSPAGFAALQISCAAKDDYGVAIPVETIEQRDLRTRDEGAVVPCGDGLTLRRDHPEPAAASGPMFPALVMLAVVPWLLLVAALLRAYRAGIREWVRQTIMWGSLGVLLMCWIGPWLAITFRILQPWAMRAFVEIPVMRMGRTAVGTLAVWVTAVVLVALAYRIAQSQFLRMEIPTRPSQYTLLRLREH